MRVLPLIGLLMLSAPAAAAESAVDAGRRAAQHRCADCHDISGKMPAAHPPGGGPSFLEIIQRRETTAQKLRQYLRYPHGRMTDLLLTGKEADNAVAYILSLRQE